MISPKRGSVLVVENEPFMREAMEDILDTIGLKVIGVGDGQEGIDTYVTNQDKIDLVILDMRLPGMGGAEILRKLRTINPLVKVIIASGYDEQEVRQQIPDYQSVSFLKKPYNADVLLSTVERFLA